MKYSYKALYEKNAALLQSKPALRKTVLVYNALIPYLFLAAYAFLWVYGGIIAPLTPKQLSGIFFSPALGLLLVTMVRPLIDRPRPYSEEGVGILPLKEKSGKGNSFPSRHLTCAAVIATVFLPYLPAVAALLYALTLGLGYARFAIGWHYPSDLIAGICLGVACGCFIFL